MQRIDDDARQPRRIEQALLQVELPGAILLRQEKPLQPVGEACDHALKMRELLVEVAAQAIELFGLAQFLGADGFVEPRRERPIIRPTRLIARVTWTPWLGSALRIGHFGIVSHLGGRRVDRLRGAIGQFVGRCFGFGRQLFAFGRIRGLAVLSGLILLIAVLALFAFLFVGFGRPILAHIQAVEQIVHDIAKAALIVKYAFEPIEIAAGALLDQRPPQLDELARGRRRRLPGEALAHHHR
jgi:hypothetical protein